MRYLSLFLFLLVPALAAAQAPAPAADEPMLEISGATFRPYPIAIASPLASGDAAAAGEEIYEALTFDLEASGLFEVVPRKAFLADAMEPASVELIKWSRWSDVSAEGLVKLEVTKGEKGFDATFLLYDVTAQREDLKKTYSASSSDARRMAHLFADDLVRHFTGEPGAFSTRIAFTRKAKGQREIWVSDWDGRNAAPASQRGGLSMLPLWSPDGSQLSYTHYRRTLEYPNGHPQIWRATVGTGRQKSFFTDGDILTGGAWSPDGTKLAFTRSRDGNAEIYVINADGSGLKRLTNSPGIDTSPTWSPDGKRIAFVSDRHGSPQIFVLDLAGGEAQRLTFQGNYNQTPAWSPRGDEIAFTARDERLAFDVFVVNVESREIRRITQGQGNNEGPTWAPNGRMLMFRSDRDGTESLWVSSADGNVQKKISLQKGFEYSQPAWGPLPKL